MSLKKEAREQQLGIRLNSQEMELIKKAAEKADIPASNYARHVILEAAKTYLDKPPFPTHGDNFKDAKRVKIVNYSSDIADLQGEIIDLKKRLEAIEGKI